ncbi:MAG: DEAD/DEAH box helicase, partial [Paludibacteraceae bacterium]|nr:DEAD/DEAH box helicase [Paludibacteraceae bacterium]
MQIQEIQNRINKYPQIALLGKKIAESESNHFVCKGVCSSANALLMGALQNKIQKNILIIWSDTEQARYLFADLLTLSQPVLFFPTSYRKKKIFDDALSIQRNETLSSLIAQPSQPHIIVTYPEAIAEVTPTKQLLQDDILHFNVGQTIPISTLIDQLLERKFVQVDFVYEPGQFAIRGGIVDIFSYNFENPYRLDFFGDEIDSIRIFDIETQLSQRKLENINIISNPTIEEKANQCTLLDYLTPDTVFVSNDFSANALIFNKLNAISDKNTIELKDSSTFFASQQIISFQFTPQPLFHKNFETLTDDLIDRQKQGYELFILCEHKKQTDRLQSIFDSYPNKEHISFEPIEQTLHNGFVDAQTHFCCYTDHEIFERFHRVELRTEAVRKGKAVITLKEINQLQIGDYVVHTTHGIGKFGGLVRTQVNGRMQEMIQLFFRDGDTVFVSIHNLHRISKYKGKDGIEPIISKIGSSAWEKKKERTKERLKAIARDLIQVYAQRKGQKGFQFSPDSYLQQSLEASFLYEDTVDQAKTTADVKRDMESDKPMDRLVCGDVGFGKTEVAMRAAFKAVSDSKQVAVLVPTTVLALQHYKTFTERFKNFPVKVQYLSRGKNAKETKEILEQLQKGEIDVLIGTHKIVGKSVVWKDLGLLIVDEEQKFGVAIKDKIKLLRTNIDVLTLTATPIPRTLQFSLLGARDLSVMTTPPPNRYPIETEIITSQEESVIQEAVELEMQRNGQIFAVANRIELL